MTRKWKIFGIQTDVEWYDVKTKFKQLLRKITYSWLFQELICLIVMTYMRLVYYSCKKVFINQDVLDKAVEEEIPFIISFWHNRLMMTCLSVKRSKNFNKKHKMMVLASKHGDGKFVGTIMGKMGMQPVWGSSNDGRKSSRGIGIGSFKKIIKNLKKGGSLSLTPDGPRGPNQKINGEIVNIARISGAKILPISYSTSRFKKLRTWDKFYIPLPFSKLCFHFDEALIDVSADVSKLEIEQIKQKVEERMTLIQEKSQEIASEITSERS